MTELVLPWPPKELSPNARLHWSKKSKAAKAYRAACYLLTKQAGVKVDWEGRVLVSLEYYPPNKRPRDLDNMLASTKSGLDGLADALNVNDKRFNLNISVADKICGFIKVTISKPNECINC